jgi:hypothetical protein
VTVDDADAKLSGTWTESTASPAFVGHGYRHDAKGEHGAVSARFETTLPKAGRYEVFLALVPNPNRATQAEVRIDHAAGPTTRTVNLAKGPADNLVSLGTYDFDGRAPAAVTLTNTGANGFVVIDAVNWQAR